MIKTVSRRAALLASLFVSLTIVPVLAYWFLKAPRDVVDADRVRAEADGLWCETLLARLDGYGQGAAHGVGPLDRHRDGDDGLAGGVAADDGAPGAGERHLDLLQAVAAGRADILDAGGRAVAAELRPEL